MLSSASLTRLSNLITSKLRPQTLSALNYRPFSNSYQSNDGQTTNNQHKRAIVYGAGIALVSATLLYKSTKKLLQVKTCSAATCATPSPPDGAGDADKLNHRQQYNFVADVVEKASPSVVFIKKSGTFRRQHGTGSGFIISPDGLIVTNAHVVQSARNGQVQVELVDGRKYVGTVQVVDSASDLALVKINDTNLPFIALGSSASLRPGEWVVAVGSPMSLSNTVTCGIVSSLNRKSSELGLSGGMDYIQTDAAITFGNSGGPLINLDGEAVGVNSMKVAEGISFAIPADYVKTFLTRAETFKKTMEARKKSQPRYIGVSTLSLTPDIAAQLSGRSDIGRLEVDRGVFIVNVAADSPAHVAGLRRYDVILKIDGETVAGAHDLERMIRNKEECVCTVHRDGKVFTTTVKPAGKLYHDL